jgi:hypothetical protein
MPPQWRLERTAEFEADCETLRERAPRLHQVLESWEWYLERIPERFSRGLLGPTDTDRVARWEDTDGDGQEYVAGITLRQPERTVRLRWLQVLESEGE